MKIYRLILCSVLISLFASCSTHKNRMPYFQDIDTTEAIPLGDYLVKIKPGDELLITVSSSNPQATAAYNLFLINPVSPSNTSRQNSPEQQTYIVDTQGYINFPVLGKLYVEGLNVEQIQDLITDKIKADVEDPLVSVSLVRFSIIVAGEVHSPGRKNVGVQRYSILDAIAAAGDLNQYGRRDNILLIREENGQRIHTRLDLTSADILSSPYFYMKQNDYIYVEPNEIRQENAEYNTYNSFRLSVVSTIVSGCATVISLIIALMR